LHSCAPGSYQVFVDTYCSPIHGGSMCVSPHVCSYELPTAARRSTSSPWLLPRWGQHRLGCDAIASLPRLLLTTPSSCRRMLDCLVHLCSPQPPTSNSCEVSFQRPPRVSCIKSCQQPLSHDTISSSALGSVYPHAHRQTEPCVQETCRDRQAACQGRCPARAHMAEGP
jgi:hypothetical protein